MKTTRVRQHKRRTRSGTTGVVRHNRITKNTFTEIKTRRVLGFGIGILPLRDRPTGINDNIMYEPNNIISVKYVKGWKSIRAGDYIKITVKSIRGRNTLDVKYEKAKNKPKMKR